MVAQARETATEDAGILAARAFLRTVVVFDDTPARGDRSDVSDEPLEAPEDADASLRAGADAVAIAQAEEVSAEGWRSAQQPPPDGSTSRFHPLDADALQKSFADLDVICSVYFRSRRAGAAGLPADTEEVARLAARSDVLIMDWDWGGDGGTFCRTVIDGLVNGPHGRRQLVLIYTGTDDQTAFAGQLGRIDGMSARRPEAPFSFQWDNCRVTAVVFQKASSGAHEIYPNSLVAEQDLPARVLEVFAETSGGLLANAVMHGLGHLRESTHRILDRFKPALDSAYVVHRAYTVPATDAEAQVEELLVDALSDALRSSGVRDRVGENAVLTSLGEKAHQQLPWETSQTYADVARAFGGEIPRKKKTNSGTKVPEARLQMIQALGALTREGQDSDAAPDAPAKNHHRRFAALIYCADDKATTSAERSNRNAVTPTLGPGVVVSRGSGDSRQFLLCVQPACDAARVAEGGATFPFLRIAGGNKEGAMGLVLPTGPLESEPWECHVRPRLDQLEMWLVKPQQPKQPVRATRTEEYAHQFSAFTVGGQETDLSYVTRLRPMVAQAIVQRLGSHGARVGLMESEYVRLGGG